MKKIIIYFPFKIDINRPSASQIRPVKLMNAFRKCGYEVDVVEGHGTERKKQISAIKENIEKGIKYDFLYSESSTMPTLLTEKHHLPIYPFLDFNFFLFCKKNGIKIGLFYRDIYWCFRKEQNNWKQKVAKYFYRYDLKKYKQLVDVFFLPSLDMLKFIPFNFEGKVEALPSGLDIQFTTHKKIGNSLNLLYIGGIGLDYNLKMIVRIVSEIPDINLIICCREDDWKSGKSEYESYLSDRIIVVHKKGKELSELYQQADLFNLFVEPSKYRNFAVPFKLFETIGYGCPVLSSEGTWVSGFVKEKGIGVVCKYHPDELKRTLQGLIHKTENLEVYKKKTREIAYENTWEARCRKIITLLQ